MKNGEEQPKRERERERGKRVKKEREGEGEKGDPRCASYVCARTAQRDSKPPSIRPRDKCVPRRETKRRDDSSSFVKPFSGTNGDDNGEGGRRGTTARLRDQWNLRCERHLLLAFLLRGRVITQEEYVSRRTFLASSRFQKPAEGDFQRRRRRALAWAEYYICISYVFGCLPRLHLATAMAFARALFS